MLDMGPGDVARLAEHLPNTHEALGSILAQHKPTMVSGACGGGKRTSWRPA